MARGAPRSRARAHAHEFVVVEDDTATTDISNQHASPDANIALLDRHDTNTDRSPHDFIDNLTDKLKELHIYSPKKNRGDRSLLPTSNSRPTRLSVHSVDTEIFPLLEAVKEEAEDCDNCPAETIHAQGPIPAQPPRVIEGVPSLAETNALTASASQAQDSFEASVPSEVSSVIDIPDNQRPLSIDPHIQSSIARHKAGQYDYVLSVPGPDGQALRIGPPSRVQDESQSFGCNILAQNHGSTSHVCSQGKPTNTYQILATPLGHEGVVSQRAHQYSDVEEAMAVAEPVVRLLSPTPAGNDTALNKTSQSGITVTIVEQTRPDQMEPSAKETEHRKESSIDVLEHPKDRVVSVSTDDSSFQAPRTPSRSTSASSQSRIEDSLEAIDRLEEQLELVDAAITPPSRTRRHQAANDGSPALGNSAIRRNGSLLNHGQPSSAGPKPVTSQTRPTHKKSVSIVDERRATGSPAKVTPTRSSVSRPTSLLPPIKSTKPPTKPSFELPGEAVARRLKEQREARQAQQAQEKAAAVAAAAPQRRRSTKALTRPTFELPGEAISKRKREDREARLRQQEEDERKRREFKARPIRAKLNSASYPRETATSRARQGKASESSEVGQVEQNSSKRSSIVVAPRTPVARPTSNRSPQARGRGLSQATVTSQISRGTSTSTTSMGKRSTLSAEDLEQQKMKGREVFERDNGYLEDKERERRERELNAKLAREQAAERSRQASREWAEKQRRKQLAAAHAVARQAV
ncbi:carboxylesterase family protein [Colletotrichum kahawae]|uniref:Carboxylesterase family protein n=1 Tax=Colletotrichum kahawae TaxID=34407 RepID=A0AAE0DAV3_COLKA|nr:carboxylesterase family protein [Colletotrichum kahawae]